MGEMGEMGENGGDMGGMGEKWDVFRQLPHFTRSDFFKG